jgi:hypothetical protein
VISLPVSLATDIHTDPGPGCELEKQGALMKAVRVVALVVLIGSVLDLSARGQTQGRISGQITDTSGAVIVGARVTIENRGTQVRRALTSNGSGDYVVPGIEPGIYSISVEAPNFRKVVRERVQVEVATDLKIDFQLPAGAISEVLESRMRRRLSTPAPARSMVCYPTKQSMSSRSKGETSRTYWHSIPEYSASRVGDSIQ